jgi:uncharacterized protein YggE
MAQGNESIIASVAIIAIIAMAAVLLFSTLSYRIASRPVSPASAGGNITLTATGSVSEAPTQATLYININATGSTASSATANLSAYASSLNSTLSKLMIMNGTSIKTTSYSLYRIYNSTSYAASQGIEVIAPLNATPGILTAISNVKGIRISDIAIGLSSQQSASMRSIALSMAMQNATSQAQSIAGIYAPVRLTNLVINSGNGIPPVIYSAQSASNAEIFPGTSALTVSVTATFSYGLSG